MNIENLTLPIRALMGVSALQNKVSRQIEASLDFYKITYSEFMALFHLNCAADHTMRRVQLAELIGLSASGVTRLLAPMENAGLVDRVSSHRDARISMVKLTRSGKALFKQSSHRLEKAAEKQTRDLSTEELKQFIALLYRIM